MEIEVVVDVRQELFICLAVSFPVDAVDVGNIELLVNLLPDMVEDIFALLGRLVFEYSVEADAFLLSCGSRNLGYAAAIEHEHIFVILARIDGAHHPFGDYLDAVVLEVEAAQVHALLETYYIIKLLAVLSHVVVAKSSGESCQLDDPVLSVLQIQDELLDFLSSLLLCLHAVLGFLLVLFLVLVQLGNVSVFLVFHEFCIVLSIEEHDVDVAFCTPASVAAVSGLVGGPCHGLSATCPTESSVSISALGQVGYLTGLSVDYSYILVVPSSVRLVVAEDVPAVWTPFERLVPVGI